MTTWNQFSEIFPGNTSDFSDAIRIAFFEELKLKALTEWRFKAQDTDILPLFAFCEVHFKRSMKRVSQNLGVVAMDKEDFFYKDIESICNIPSGQFGLFKRKCRKFVTDFPNAHGWLSWYLNPQRAPIFFPACRSLDNDHMTKKLCKNTNAQENVGKQFQESSIKSKL